MEKTTAQLLQLYDHTDEYENEIFDVDNQYFDYGSYGHIFEDIETQK